LNALVTKSHLAVPCIAVEKVQSNPLIHKCIHEYRKKFGAIVLPMELEHKGNSLKHSRQEVLWQWQSIRRCKGKCRGGIFRACCTDVPGSCSLQSPDSAPILIGLAVRQADGTYRVMFHKVPSDDLDGAIGKNIVELTQRHHKINRTINREHPEQWMWMHRRWKHVPDRVHISL